MRVVSGDQGMDGVIDRREEDGRIVVLLGCGIEWVVVFCRCGLFGGVVVGFEGGFQLSWGRDCVVFQCQGFLNFGTYGFFNIVNIVVLWVLQFKCRFLQCLNM